VLLIWARFYLAGINMMATGDGTSKTCRVGVNLPVCRSMSKMVILSESWFAKGGRHHDGIAEQTP